MEAEWMPAELVILNRPPMGRLPDADTPYTCDGCDREIRAGLDPMTVCVGVYKASGLAVVCCSHACFDAWVEAHRG